MPWKIEPRNDEWCVVKESDGEVEGCHASRGQAVAQQRALYAKEAQTAAANGGPEPTRFEMAAAPFRMEVTSAVDEALVASISAMTERLLSTEKTLSTVVEVLKTISENAQAERETFRETLTAAVNVPREIPVVNVNVPEPVVNVTVPEPIVNVRNENPAPVVNVSIPGSKKTITFERDPLTGSVSKAQVEEEVE